jgi:hypothetical protein
MTLHLIPEPEEKASELLRDLTANDTFHDSRRSADREPIGPWSHLFPRTKPPAIRKERPHKEVMKYAG